MQKTLMIISIILSAMGARSVAEAIDSSTNWIVMDLKKAGLSFQEIQNLDKLSQSDLDLFRKAVEQDLRIKGKLKIEVLASANKGGGPCIQGGQD